MSHQLVLSQGSTRSHSTPGSSTVHARRMGLVKKATAKLNLEPDLIAPKIIYTFYFAGLSCVLPYYSIFYRSIGLDNQQIGILGFLRPFVNFLGAPLCAAIADKTRRYKAMLISNVILTTLFRFSMIFTQGNFGAVCATLILCEFTGSAVNPLLDSSVMDILGPERASLYGRQRMFGSGSWGITAFIASTIVTALGDMRLFFVGHLFVMTIFLGIVLKFPITKAAPAAEPSTTSFWSKIQVLCYSVETVMFFVTVFIMGLSVGVYSNFLFLFLQDLGSTSTMLGLGLIFNSISEITFMFYAGNIIKKIGSRNSLYIALVAYALRLLSYSVLYNPWLDLPIELFHGITFGLAWNAMVQHARTLAPPGLGATVQGIVSGVFAGLGNGCGALFGGFAIDVVGARHLFMIASASSAFSLLLFLMSSGVSKLKGTYKKLSSNHEEHEEHHDETDEEEDGNHFGVEAPTHTKDVEMEPLKEKDEEDHS